MSFRMIKFYITSQDRPELICEHWHANIYVKMIKKVYLFYPSAEELSLLGLDLILRII